MSQASKCFRTSSTSRMLDVRGRLRCACNGRSCSRPPRPRPLRRAHGCHTVAGARWQNLPSQVDTTAELRCGCTHRPMPASCSPPEDPSHPPPHPIPMVSRTNTTRNPNQKPGPTNCILNSPNSKILFILGVLGSTAGSRSLRISVIISSSQSYYHFLTDTRPFNNSK